MSKCLQVPIIYLRIGMMSWTVVVDMVAVTWIDELRYHVSLLSEHTTMPQFSSGLMGHP